MNTIRIFQNEQFGRMRILVSEQKQPLFCLADVCTILELRQAELLQQLNGHSLAVRPLETQGGVQQAYFIDEDGLFDTLFESRSPGTKAFCKWVTIEVLPCIHQQQRLQYSQPQAASSLASPNSCLMAELAKVLKQNGVNFGQNRLFAWMRDNGYLCQRGQYYNQPTQKAMQLGLFELKQIPITRPGGMVLMTTTTKVTSKGQAYFLEKFLGN